MLTWTFLVAESRALPTEPRRTRPIQCQQQLLLSEARLPGYFMLLRSEKLPGGGRYIFTFISLNLSSQRCPEIGKLHKCKSKSPVPALSVDFCFLFTCHSNFQECHHSLYSVQVNYNISERRYNLHYVLFFANCYWEETETWGEWEDSCI